VNKKDEALKMAIELCRRIVTKEEIPVWYARDTHEACKEALEQPAQEPVSCHCGNPAFNLQSLTHTKTKCFQHSLQNPVAWTDEYEMFLEFDKEILCDKAVCKEHEAIPLYTHPKQWQGLTDDETDAIIKEKDGVFGAVVRAVEQALKDKNT
jgi:hypothetical protein